MGGTLFSGALGAQEFVDQGITTGVWIVSTYGRARKVRVLAQVDTGSTDSSIDTGLAGLLRLRRQGSTPVYGFGGIVQAPLYAAALTADSGQALTPGPVLGAVLATEPIRTWADYMRALARGDVLALLGREALAHIDLSITGPAGSWTATAPSA